MYRENRSLCFWSYFLLKWCSSYTFLYITIDTIDEVHVCQLCGCWYETRKGLSSHARAHLRQIGVPDNNIKCSPIDFLYQLMEEEDLKPLASLTEEPLTSDTSTKSSFKRPADLSSPSSSPSVKRLKVPEECILCGDEFENRKGLGSHARSHLRQMGMIDLMGKNTAIETIEELVKSGMLKALCPSKKASKSSSSAVTFTTPASPDALRLSPAVVHTQSAVKNIQLPLTYITKAPKAKKGSRFAVDPLHRKTKPESVEIDISVQPEASIMSITNTPTQESPTAVGSLKSFSTGLFLYVLIMFKLWYWFLSK